MRKYAATLACVVVLTALPLVLFWPVTLGGYTLLPVDNLFQYEPFRTAASSLGVGAPQNHLLSDLILENYQWKRFIVEALRGGEVPLWNPYLFAGVPFLAAGQHSALYPPSLLYYVMPLAQAYGWYTELNLALAGVFMFVFARGLGLSRAASTFAGVAWQLSAFLVVSVVFQMMIGAAAWLPLILAMADRVIGQSPGLRGRPSSAPWAIIGALAIAMQTFAGHVEITVYTALVTAAYCAHRLFWMWRRGGGQRRIATLANRAAWLAAMAGVGAALGAVQLAPLFELVTSSFRASRATYAEIVGQYAFPARYITQWLMPNLYGNPAQHTYLDWFSLAIQAVPTASGHTEWGYKNYVEGGAFMGVVTLVLAAISAGQFAIGARRRPETGGEFNRVPRGFHLALSGVSLAFIFGTPLYALLYFGVPGVNQLHSPFRWIFPLTLGGIVLAADGIDRIRRAPVDSRLARVVRRAAAAAVALGVACAAGLGLARAGWPAIEPLVQRVAQSAERASGNVGIAANPRFFFSAEATSVALFALSLIAAGIVIRALAGGLHDLRNRRPGLVAALPVALVAAELMAAWWGFNPAADPALLQHVPDAIKFLQQDTTLWRMNTYDPGGHKPLNANAAWQFGIADARGYDSIIPKRYVDYMQVIEPQGELQFNRIAPLTQRSSLESPLLDVLNVKYILTQDPIDPPVQGLTRVYDDGRTQIWRNDRVMPRAYVMPLTSGLLTANFAAAVQKNDPRRYVMIDASCGVTDIGCMIPQPAQYKPAVITSYRNNEVWVDTEVSEPAWLILGDSYFPGWRAWVRPWGADADQEREVDILPANGNFRAVRLPFADAVRKPAEAVGALGGGGLAPAGPAPEVPAVAQRYTVRFRYTPDSFRLGGFASLVAGVCMLLVAGAYVWRSIAHRDEASASSARRVARNSLTLTGLSMLSRLVDMGFATIMLRFLGPAGNGNFTFAVIVVSWFEILMNFGLNTFLTRDVARDRAHSTHYFYNTSFIRLAMSLVAAPLLAGVILIYVWLDGITVETQWTIGLLVFSQLPGSLATGLSALFFAHERAEVPASLTIVSALAKAVLGAAALAAGWGIVGLALVSIVTNVMTLIMLAVAAHRELGLHFSLREAARDTRSVTRASSARMLRESAPLAVNHLLSTIFFKIDVPLLKALTRDAATVGYYSVGYKYVDAFNIIPSLFTQALFPTLSRMAADVTRAPGTTERSAFARAYVLAVKMLVMIALPLSVAVSFLAGPMIAVLGGSAFLPQGALALAIVIWHMPVGWINSVTNYALIAAGQQRRLTNAFVGAVLFNIIANLIFIPRFGFVAASVVTVLSEVAQLVTFYFYVRAHITRMDWLRVLAKPALGAGLMAAVSYAGAQAGWLLPGLFGGALVYAAVVLGLRAFDASERGTLGPLLPAWAQRLMGA